MHSPCFYTDILRAIKAQRAHLAHVRGARRAPQKRTCADSAPADARRERGRSAHGRRDAHIAAQGRQAAPGGIPTKPDAAHGRMRRASLAARASSGGVTAAHPRPRARANRAAHRPRSGTQRCEMHRAGKRPHPNAIWRLRSGAGAMRDGAFRARVPLGRWTAHADWHPTHGTTSQPQHRTHGTKHTAPNTRRVNARGRGGWGGWCGG